MTASKRTGEGAHDDRPATSCVVALLVTGVLVTACSSDRIIAEPLPLSGSMTTVPAGTGTTTAAAVPAGYTRFISEHAHLSIAVPADWKRVDPTNPNATSAIEELAKSNPKLAKGMSPNGLVAAGIRFIAADDTGSGDSLSVMVRRLQAGTDTDFERLAERLKPGLEARNATLRADETVLLAGRTALRLTIDGDPTAPGGPDVTVQYLLFVDDLGYTVTLTGENAHFGTIASTFTVT